jgi:hypothetical protein
MLRPIAPSIASPVSASERSIRVLTATESASPPSFSNTISASLLAIIFGVTTPSLAFSSRDAACAAA